MKRSLHRGRIRVVPPWHWLSGATRVLDPQGVSNALEVKLVLHRAQGAQLLSAVQSSKSQEHHGPYMLRNLCLGEDLFQAAKSLFSPHYVSLHRLCSPSPNVGQVEGLEEQLIGLDWSFLRDVVLQSLEQESYRPCSVSLPSESLVFNFSCCNFLTASYVVPVKPALKWTRVADCVWSFPSRPCHKSHARSQYSSNRSGSPEYCGTPYRSVSSFPVTDMANAKMLFQAPAKGGRAQSPWQLRSRPRKRRGFWHRRLEGGCSRNQDQSPAPLSIRKCTAARHERGSNSFP